MCPVPCVLHADTRMDVLVRRGSQTWPVKYPWGTVTHSCDSGSSPAFFLVFWPLLCAPPRPVGDPGDLRNQSPSAPNRGQPPEGPLLRTPKVRKELIRMLPEVEVPGDLQGTLVWGYAQTHCQGGSMKLQRHLVVEAGLAGTRPVTLGSHSRPPTPDPRGHLWGKG